MVTWWRRSSNFVKFVNLLSPHPGSFLKAPMPLPRGEGGRSDGGRGGRVRGQWPTEPTARGSEVARYKLEDTSEHQIERERPPSVRTAQWGHHQDRGAFSRRICHST